MDLAVNHIRWIVRNFSKKMSDNKTCLIGKTAIVTGGNAGLGYATSVLLASRGCRVIIACRSNADSARDNIIDLTRNPHIITKHLDLSKLKTVRKFAEDIKNTEPKIDILINNAGIGASSEHCTEDGLNYVMQVNYFGHFLLTHLLMDELKNSKAKVVFLSSGLAIFHTLTPKSLNITKFDMNSNTVSNFYSNSKLCNMLAAQEFGEKLSKYGITVNSADPGVVRTKIFTETSKVRMGFPWLSKCVLGMITFLYSADVYVGAQTPFHLAASKLLKTGEHYFRCKPFMKPEILNDKEFCHKIWLNTENLVDLKSTEKLI